MQVKPIKTKEEYAHSLVRLKALVSKPPPQGSTEADELGLLSLVIKDYENKIVAPVRPDAVSSILFMLDQKGLTKKDLIPLIGSAEKVSAVLTRKSPLSLAMIRKLNEVLDIPAQVLITKGQLSRTGTRKAKVPLHKKTVPGKKSARG